MYVQKHAARLAHVVNAGVPDRIHPSMPGIVRACAKNAYAPPRHRHDMTSVYVSIAALTGHGYFTAVK